VRNNEQLLIAYKALSHPIRLKAIIEIAKNPGISFSELLEKLAVKSSLLAYHLAVLKSADLVTIRYERKSKKVSHYYLTEFGERILKEIHLEK